MEDLVYWIWLQQALKYGSHKVKLVAELYDDIGDFYAGGEQEWRVCGIFSNKEIEKMKSTTIWYAKEIIKKCNFIKCEAISYADERFPYLLKQIENPPAVIYVRGDLKCLDNAVSVAVVGTRKASEYGAIMAREFCEEFAKNDAVVVSGGAMGIDSIAHDITLKYGGKTICVLGCGLDYSYLPGKAFLRKQIENSGAVVSEYSPGTPAYSTNFPIRNRIISGLALGTVVIEAGEKSGSLITANLANEQNRDVYIIPPLAENLYASGSTSLIRDGARVVSSASEILEEYRIRRIPQNNFAFGSHRASKKSYEFKNFGKDIIKKSHNQGCATKQKSTSNLSEIQKSVFDLISKGKIHIDKIAESLDRPTYELIATLTELEISGYISSLPGKYYEVI